ncbi:ATP adenylyltransferase-domain-containing protein [Hyaloscypha sp. PMI_1271]|nr:ATP adenylyltransferase-domain-containing protein [Hyaloscypha sp. PMI_1271]
MEKEESLEERSLRQFDALVERGNLLWRTTTPQLIKADPFNFQFRSANSLTAKPILSSTDPGRSKSTNAFSDTDPDFLLSHIGPSHTLILNKYCVVRPQFLLHTNTFIPQSDHLTESDLAAAWTVLSSLTRGKYIVIYNCGFEGGSSVGHKHLQILPRPKKEEGFEFFPDLLGIDSDTSTVPKIPFRYSVKKLLPSPSAAQLIGIYKSLVEQARVKEAAGHNVLLTKDWMLVIPRTKGRKGILSANAAAMAGMVWVTGEEEVRQWVEAGPMKLLCEFGVVDQEVA